MNHSTNNHNNRSKYNLNKKTVDYPITDSRIEEEMISQEKTTRIWICSWNMGAKNHFKLRTLNDGSKVVDESEIDQFEQFVPTNYDLYVFGIQEGVDDIFFNLLDKYLRRYKVYRLQLSSKDSCVHGRGDGSLFSTKYTGIAIYIHKNKKKYIQYKKCAAVSAGITQGSKGAACVALKIYSSTIAFLSTHMSSNRPEDKLAHFKTLMKSCGSKLGCHHFDLKEQFHHIVWFGDLNYRITDSTVERVLMDMAMGNLEKLWVRDTLNEELRLNRTFSGFVEPNHRLDFYPTYKKKTDRMLDFDETPISIQQMNDNAKERNLGLLGKIYKTKYKEPIYKGGLVKDRIPSFCDRILLHSLKSTNGQLLPEKDTGVLNCVQETFMDYGCDNYGAIPHYLRGSDHSAIYCGLILRSAIQLPCPPNESAENGTPLCYQLKILNIVIVRSTGPYYNNTTFEVPTKTKFCFPAPYELEHDFFPGPESSEILKQEFEIYHDIQRQIAEDSERRVSMQMHNEYEKHMRNDSGFGQTKSVIDSFSTKHQIKRKIQENSDLGYTPPYSVMSESNSYDVHRQSTSPTKKMQNLQMEKRRESAKVRKGSANINRQRNIPPSAANKSVNAYKDMRRNIKHKSDSLNNKKRNYKKSRSHHPCPPPRNLQSDVIQSSHSLTIGDNKNKHTSIDFKKKEIRKRNMKRYPPPTDPPPVHPRQRHQQILPKNLIMSSAPPTPVKSLTHKIKKDGSVPLMLLADEAVAADSQTKAVDFVFPLSTPTQEMEDENVKNRRRPLSDNSLSLIDVANDNSLFEENVKNEIYNDYFEETKSNESNHNSHNIRNKNKNKERITKIRSSSKRKNNRKLKRNDSLISPILRRSRSKSVSSFKDILGINAKPSPKTERLYKAASEQAQKLTLTSYGPNRRPSHGYIHCCIRVKSGEIVGQTTIPFKWSAFARGEYGTKEAPLTYSGLPLYDEESGKIVKIMLEYKCLLVAKR